MLKRSRLVTTGHHPLLATHEPSPNEPVHYVIATVQKTRRPGRWELRRGNSPARSTSIPSGAETRCNWCLETE
jgi:hypothetical protein